MKFIKKIIFCSSLLLLCPFLTSCITDTKSQEKNNPTAQELIKPQNDINPSAVSTQPAGLPVKYQTPNYLVDKKVEKDLSIAEEAKLKVEARITSTKGPQPLWDIVKRIAALKGMNVSWASDVDQNVLVDVNISANDEFFGAIDNLLRQVDYYHEVQGSTIIVKNKETRQFQIAMPFIKQTYKTKTGGDVLGAGGGAAGSTNVAGEITLSSEGVSVNQSKDGKPGGIEFNTWNSIENNLNAILNVWTVDEAGSKPAKESNQPTVIIQQSARSGSKAEKAAAKVEPTNIEPPATATFRRSSGGNTYFIDKPVGLITVTAPRSILERLEVYFKSLQKELYKQVSIEAKILEIQLDDSSSIGLNWNLILRNLAVAGGSVTGGKTYGRANSDGTTNSNTQTNTNSVSDTNTTNNVTTATGPDQNNTTGVITTETGNTFDGTNTINNVISNVAGSAVSSGITAATVLTQGVTGTLGGAISLAAFNFDSFLNAVSTQGKATILSNPKLSVLNGQPSLLTVGRNITYISKIDTDISDTGVVTTSAETARALSGVGLALTANILNDKEIILNLVPVTSELVEPIEYRTIGAGVIGLPIVNVREMSTTVRVKNGEMLVIGGLISSVSEDDGTFVPGTSNLGFFKYLFGNETKSKRKRELIILLKPRII